MSTVTSPSPGSAFVGEGHLADSRKAWNRILTAMRSCPQCKELVGRGGRSDKLQPIGLRPATAQIDRRAVVPISTTAAGRSPE